MKLNVLATLEYGSHLYGTSTSTSDTDLKAIYLPPLSKLLLGKKLHIYKVRRDADGEPVPDHARMPDNGVETEFIPFQTFVHDVVHGQTYAIELAYSMITINKDKITPELYAIMLELIAKFKNSDVYSMVGFAKKAVFDYVDRGGRLLKAQGLLNELRAIEQELRLTDKTTKAFRLDTLIDGERLIDVVARQTGIPLGTVTNVKVMTSLELNGRSYSEASDLAALQTTLEKYCAKYGSRSTAAATDSVDYKSLSHAVRVYQQAIELLRTGNLVFPRPNAARLLAIKSGQIDLEIVKAELVALDAEIQRQILGTTIPGRTPELVQASEKWCFSVLTKLYNLPVVDEFQFQPE